MLQLLDQAGKAFHNNLGRDAFQKWTLLYDPAILALIPAYSA